MHEILHTYHFLSLRRKNTFPSFHASWRKSYIFKELHTYLMKIIQASWNILRSYRKVFCYLSNEATLLLNLFWALVRFSLFQNILPKDQYCTPFLLHMQYAVWCLCYAKWCDDVMLCKITIMPQIHIPVIKHTHFLYQRWLFAVSLP